MTQVVRNVRCRRRNWRPRSCRAKCRTECGAPLAGHVHETIPLVRAACMYVQLISPVSMTLVNPFSRIGLHAPLKRTLFEI